MTIRQAYVSKSIADFPFHQIYQLDDYNDAWQPAVFFGCYRYEDTQVISNHKAQRYVFWTGQDIINMNGFTLAEANHVTAHPKVFDMLVSKFGSAQLVKPAAFLNEVKAQELGKKIYAYCPTSAPTYHGSKIIDDLRCAGYEITIGDGTWSQDQWRNGKADEFYKDVGIGLCLSEFAGGGTSIIEMGLRGIRVVTNVFHLPHCIKFTDAQHVAGIIEAEKKKIGETDKLLALSVWNSLDHEHKWLQI